VEAYTAPSRTSRSRNCRPTHDPGLPERLPVQHEIRLFPTLRIGSGHRGRNTGRSGRCGPPSEAGGRMVGVRCCGLRSGRDPVRRIKAPSPPQLRPDGDVVSLPATAALLPWPALRWFGRPGLAARRSCVLQSRRSAPAGPRYRRSWPSTWSSPRRATQVRLPEDAVEPSASAPPSPGPSPGPHARTADLRPFSTAACGAEVLYRLFVQEPMNTPSIGISASGVPGRGPYRPAPARRAALLASSMDAGSGTRSESAAHLRARAPVTVARSHCRR
jgi:hypothetical protein